MSIATLTKRIFDRAQDSDRAEVKFKTTRATMEALHELADVLGRNKEDLLSECVELMLQEYARKKLIMTPKAKAQAGTAERSA